MEERKVVARRAPSADYPRHALVLLEDSWGWSIIKAAERTDIAHLVATVDRDLCPTLQSALAWFASYCPPKVRDAAERWRLDDLWLPDAGRALKELQALEKKPLSDGALHWPFTADGDLEHSLSGYLRSGEQPLPRKDRLVEVIENPELCTPGWLLFFFASPPPFFINAPKMPADMLVTLDAGRLAPLSPLLLEVLYSSDGTTVWLIDVALARGRQPDMPYTERALLLREIEADVGYPLRAPLASLDMERSMATLLADCLQPVIRAVPISTPAGARRWRWVDPF